MPRRTAVSTSRAQPLAALAAALQCEHTGGCQREGLTKRVDAQRTACKQATQASNAHGQLTLPAPCWTPGGCSAAAGVSDAAAAVSASEPLSPRRPGCMMAPDAGLLLARRLGYYSCAVRRQLPRCCCCMCAAPDALAVLLLARGCCWACPAAWLHSCLCNQQLVVGPAATAAAVCFDPAVCF
jgi:hypothetical protein